MTTKTTKILHKRGIEQNMPQLDASEIGFSTDTSKVFVGSNAGNIELAKQTSVNSAITLAQEAKQQASDGKTKIATALTGKGVTATSSDTFDALASKIKGMVGAGSLINYTQLSPSSNGQKILEKAVYENSSTVPIGGNSYSSINGIKYYDGFYYISSSTLKLIKLNSSFVPVWSIETNLSNNKFDVDQDGNIYALVSSPTKGSDYTLVVKYSSSGVKISEHEQYVSNPTSISVDNANGRICFSLSNGYKVYNLLTQNLSLLSQYIQPSGAYFQNTGFDSLGNLYILSTSGQLLKKDSQFQDIWKNDSVGTYNNFLAVSKDGTTCYSTALSGGSSIYLIVTNKNGGRVDQAYIGGNTASVNGIDIDYQNGIYYSIYNSNGVGVTVGKIGNGSWSKNDALAGPIAVDKSTKDIIFSNKANIYRARNYALYSQYILN